MELSLKQAAEIFGVGEREVIRWIHGDGLPAALVADQYRFHRADLLEWAAVNQRAFNPVIYVAANGDLAPSATHLADALERGGVRYDVAGADLREVLHAAMSDLPIPDSLGLDNLVELIMQRGDQFAAVAVGYGIAIPHPRRPVILNVPGPHVRLCYLKRPLERVGPDGRAVDKLFIMLSSSGREHLQLLARLGAMLLVESVRALLEQKAGLELLRDAIRDAGEKFQQAAS